jgi:hypothetical protein
MTICVKGKFDKGNKNSLTPALFIEVSVLSQESEW